MPVYKLPEEPVFPRPDLAEEDGLLAIGGDLSAERLLNAYASGIFPWYSKGQPVLWWSPDPRMVLFPEKTQGWYCSRKTFFVIRTCGGLLIKISTPGRSINILSK